MSFSRPEPAADRMMVPAPAEERGRVLVDSTWGEVQPLEVAPGVETIGELELVEHLEAGRPAVDTRRAEYREQAAIPGTRGIPHDEIAERAEELDPDEITVLFCNGPQCTATPQAIRTLLDLGVPAARLRYYRGGLHDWMTLGFPVEGSRARPGA